MRAIVIFYKGNELENLTKSLIAKQLIEGGIDSSTIDMFELNNEEVAKLTTARIVHMLPNKPIINEEEEAFRHAYNYISELIGKELNQFSSSAFEAVNFTTRCLKYTGDEKLRNAFEIIHNTDNSFSRKFITQTILDTINQIYNNKLI